MKWQINGRILWGTLFVLMFLLIVFLFANLVQYAIRDARMSASLNELAQFHLEYLRKNKLSEKEYTAEVDKLCKKYEWDFLRYYLRNFQEAVKDQNVKVGDEKEDSAKQRSP